MVSTNIPLPPLGFDELPIKKKFEYVQRLWDRIAADADQVPVPQWHREILRERLQDGEEVAGTSLDWEEVLGELRRKLEDEGTDQ